MLQHILEFWNVESFTVIITKTTNIIWVAFSNDLLIDNLTADGTAIVSAAVIGDVTYHMCLLLLLLYYNECVE